MNIRNVAAPELKIISFDGDAFLLGIVSTSSVMRGALKPVTAYDIAENGHYELDGSSDSSDLYSLYYFTGKSVYHVGFHNRQASDQKFVCRTIDDDKNIYSGTIPASYIYLFDLETDKGWYIVFPNTIFGDGVDVWGNIY